LKLEVKAMKNDVCNVAVLLMFVSLFLPGAAPVFGSTDDPNYIARNPYPADGEINVATDPNLTLSWSPGDLSGFWFNMLRYEVYLDVNEANVANAKTWSPEYMGDTETTSFAVSGLEPETEYFWRVDTRLNTTRPPFIAYWLIGEVWKFTTMPEKAWDPNPADGADDVEADPNVTLSWKLGDIDHRVFTYQRYNVYYSTDFNEVIEACDKFGIAMVLTGMRHFRH